MSAAYARWALPWPWATRETLQDESSGICVCWTSRTLEYWTARLASTTGTASDMGPCRYLLHQFWPLFLAHVNSYLCTAMSTDLFAGAMVLSLQLVVLSLHLTVWWYPIVDSLFNCYWYDCPSEWGCLSSSNSSGGRWETRLWSRCCRAFDCCQLCPGFFRLCEHLVYEAGQSSFKCFAGGGEWEASSTEFLMQKVLVYIMSVAVPYMFQRSIMETANSASFRHFFNKVEESPAGRCISACGWKSTQQAWSGTRFKTTRLMAMPNPLIPWFTAAIVWLKENSMSFLIWYFCQECFLVSLFLH